MVVFGAAPTGLSTVTLGENGSTTFVVRMNAGQVGDLSGEISFMTDDPDENPFDFTISASMAETVAIIDNGDDGFVLSGTWDATFTSCQGSIIPTDMRLYEAGSNKRLQNAASQRLHPTWIKNGGFPAS